MPLFFQQNINETTKLAIWKIEEEESFFSAKIPLNLPIVHRHKRLQHLAGRYLLPMLFEEFPIEEIAIAEARKPFLPSAQFYFSISHCKDYAAAIVSQNSQVGIDVECISNRVHDVKGKFLNHSELDFTNSFFSSDYLTMLTLMWSAKEAMYKWYGLGKVDFRQMMSIESFQLQQQGSMKGIFSKGRQMQHLDLYYKIFNPVTVVWTAT